MPKDITLNWTARDDLGRSYVVQHLRNKSVDSPRTQQGELDLKQNPHTYRFKTVRGVLAPINGRAWPIRDVHGFNPIGIYDPLLETQALAKWGRAIKGKSASLGVTLATWKESTAMIKARTKNLAVRADHAIAFYHTRRGRRKAEWLRAQLAREGKEPPANLVLEGFFGWLPLMQDIHDGCEVIMSEINPDFLSVRRSKRVLESKVAWGNPASNPWTREHIDGRVRVTLAGYVDIKNPNAVFLNQLGLINPAVVLWDLVPWSFVVNAFSTTGTLISSLSDEVGFRVTERSVTWSWDQTSELFRYNRLANDPNPSNRGGHSTSVNKDKGRTRTIGTFPAPSFVLKVPNLDAAGTAIAVSLLAQKSRTIQRLTKL